MITPNVGLASEGSFAADSPAQQFTSTYQLPELQLGNTPTQGAVVLASLTPITEPTILLRTHTVARGETVDSIAEQYGISEWTLRQSNGLSTYTRVAADQELDILPADGLMYLASKNIQLDSLAAQHEISLESIRHYNPQLDGLDTLSEGEAAFLPGVSARSAVRSARRLPTSRSITSSSVGSSVNLGETTAGFYRGYCTAWAAQRTKELGNDYVTWRGNGGAWAGNAAAQGREVNKTPAVGAIVVTNEGSVGHVAVIEEVHEDGSFTISEQNYTGWNQVSQRTLTADSSVITGIIH